ncbi:Chromate transporter, chromate ion transporter (CHR) family, partial [Dysosmobacter welbionis]
ALVQLVIEVLQRPGEHPLADQLGLVIVQHPEVWGQGPAVPLPGQEVGVLPQQRRAEGVHGLDVRLIHPQQLPPELLVPRRLAQPLGQLGGDLAPQLRRGGLGVGDDEEIIDIAAFLRHIAEKPVHQYLCLAGAGGGGHQQAAAPVFHHRLLLGGQGQFCHVTVRLLSLSPLPPGARTPPALPAGCS